MSASSNTIVKATKWSVLGEIVAKLALPISSMLLARIIAPAEYGIVASVNMVLTFCELFADAGFNKYIVQHETNSDDELDKIVNIAFWTNFVLTMLIWGIICLFAKPLAVLVGCPGKELAIMVSCVNLPLHGMISIQNARLKRDMDFKTLFFLRMVSLIVPFTVTIPVALVVRNYWALIIGTFACNAIHLIAMAIKLKWIPKLYYSFRLLKEIFSFSMWSMMEAFFVWLINWGDVFIVTQILTKEYLGIYKTSMNMVGQITGIVSASIVPVFLSSLSKVQNDDKKFNELFYKFSATAGIILVPMGVGMYIYRDLMCSVALGDAWMLGSDLMGIWGLINSIAILFNSFNGNVLIAKGKPKVSVIVQIVQILIIMPTVYISANIGFGVLSYSRALIRVSGMVIYCFTVWKMYKINCFETIKRLFPTIVSTFVMACFGVFALSLNLGEVFELISVVICVVIYFGILAMFPSVRKGLIPGLISLIKR